jgi:hypothetical protein
LRYKKENLIFLFYFLGVKQNIWLKWSSSSFYESKKLNKKVIKFLRKPRVKDVRWTNFSIAEETLLAPSSPMLF